MQHANPRIPSTAVVLDHRRVPAPRLVLAASALVALGAAAARADDWPQWMGPARDNVWREDGILERFPEGGPTIVWRAPIAAGYSGPAVAGGRVFITDRVVDDAVLEGNFERKGIPGLERVLCLDAASGTVLWRHEYPVEYSISYPSGPRTTPAVDGPRVYTLGAEGRLICFEAKSGKVEWSKDLPAEYGTRTALWGYAAHPLIDGRKLITLAGGEGSHAVAFDKVTGKEIWRALSAKEQGYCPPAIITAGGVRQLILPRPGAISGVDPETGKELWSLPYEATNGSVIMTPIHWQDRLFLGGFSNKNLLVKLGKDSPTAEVEWRDERDKALSPVNVQPFLLDDVMYGFDQDGSFHAVELPSGKRVWTTAAPYGDRAAGCASAFIVRQGARFWLFTERGELLIAELSRAGFRELDRAPIVEPTGTAFGRRVVWSTPAFAGRRAYVRNDQELVCVDLAAVKTSAAVPPADAKNASAGR